jgi:hypothetical protein
MYMLSSNNATQYNYTNKVSLLDKDCPDFQESELISFYSTHSVHEAEREFSSFKANLCNF